MKKISRFIIKLIITAICVICLGFSFVRINAGTLIGVLLFGGIILITLLHRPLWSCVKWLWKRLWGKISLLLAGVLAVICLFAVVFFTANIASHIHRPLDRVDAVIVLGCRVRGEAPTSLLRSRCVAAARVLEAHPEAVCIVSGGQGSGEDISEAEAMRRLLTSYGISEQRIYMEDKSTSTAENFEFSAQLMQREGISGSVAVVTSDYHQYRASLYAKRAGLGDTGHYSGTTNAYFVLNYWLREWAALAACYVFGY